MHVMDGTNMKSGAVGCLRGVRDATRAARLVLDHTTHSLLVGEHAAAFAVEMGLDRAPLNTPRSDEQFARWHRAQCQPNNRMHVSPDPSTSCGPYTRDNSYSSHRSLISDDVSPTNHDTISMVIIDGSGRVVSGASSNGAAHKVPGRVGDAPIVGAGSYADSSVGGCGATGDGDVMMRFLPCFQVVQHMRRGVSPQRAAQLAIASIVQYFPSFSGAIIAVNVAGQHGAAVHGFHTFPYSVCSPATDNITRIFSVSPDPIVLLR